MQPYIIPPPTREKLTRRERFLFVGMCIVSAAISLTALAIIVRETLAIL